MTCSAKYWRLKPNTRSLVNPDMITLALLFAGITAIASAVHGADLLPKPCVIAIHAIGTLPCGMASLIGVSMYWGFLRRSAQARAEMDFLANSSAGNLLAIRAAYPAGIGYLVAPVIDLIQRHPLPRLSARRQQEICSGFICGLLLAIAGSVFSWVSGLVW